MKKLIDEEFCLNGEGLDIYEEWEEIVKDFLKSLKLQYNPIDVQWIMRRTLDLHLEGLYLDSVEKNVMYEKEQ